ncbi:MAG TPA: metallophosphoesterase [Labilithrix sp.]|nr:metallophosphoesterase [Labilithrix sp.]
MRIQYLSDLHFEFHADDGASFVESLDPQDIDVLVVAGDFAVGKGIGPALDRICTRYRCAVVVYVHGNHEFYGCTRAEVLAITRAAADRNPNLRWLDGDVTVIDGVRFLGVPLWFSRLGAVQRLKRAMTDFDEIRGFEDWVYAENARAIELLERELQPEDVVVTHYLPVRASIAPHWSSSPLNPFFLCDVEALIRARRPALWIHGHTHSSVDVVVGSTRVLCNPFGYVRRELNRAFREDAAVEIDTPRTAERNARCTTKTHG